MPKSHWFLATVLNHLRCISVPVKDGPFWIFAHCCCGQNLWDPMGGWKDVEPSKMAQCMKWDVPTPTNSFAKGFTRIPVRPGCSTFLHGEHPNMQEWKQNPPCVLVPFLKTHLQLAKMGNEWKHLILQSCSWLARFIDCRASMGIFPFGNAPNKNHTKLQARPCRSHQMICVSPGQSTANNTCGATVLHWWPPSHPKGFEFENFKMTLESGHSNKTLQGWNV